MKNYLPLSSAIILVLTIACTLAAGAQPMIPTTEAVCRGGIVDKNEYATFLLDSRLISRRLEDWVAVREQKKRIAGKTDEYSRLSVRQIMIVDESICAKAEEICSKTDKESLDQMRAAVALLLQNYSQYYQNSENIEDAPGYFLRDQAVLRCVAAAGVNPPDSQPVKSTKTITPFRLRGFPDGLQYARNDPDFKIVTDAQFSLSDDKIADKKIKKWNGVAGWDIRVVDDSDRYKLAFVPYVGAYRDRVKNDGKAAANNLDTLSAGIVTDLRVPGTWGGLPVRHVMTFRPEFRRSDSDVEVSHLLSVSASWVPTMSRDIIDGVRLNGWRVIDEDSFFRFIVEGRAAAGTFTKRAKFPSDFGEDFARLGGRVGFAFSTDAFPLPADFSLSYTYLPDLIGSAKDLEFLESKFSLSLDPERIFSLSLSYLYGRRSDLLIKQDEWKLSFGIKY